MSAKDYKLVVSPLTGTVYISKISKKDSGQMTSDRREVPTMEMLDAMVQYLEHNNNYIRIFEKATGKTKWEITLKT